MCSIFNLVDYLKNKNIERQYEQYLFRPNTFICPFNINTMTHDFHWKFEEEKMWGRNDPPSNIRGIEYMGVIS